MRDHLAEIRRDQIPVVHPTVLLLRVALHLRDHLRDHLHQTVRVQIAQVLAVPLVVPHLHRQDHLVRKFLDEVLIDRVLKVWDETRVDHWLHALAILDALLHHDRMNHHEPEDLHGDVHDLDQLVLMMKMRDD